MNALDQTDRSRAASGNAVIDLLALELYRSPQDVFARVEQLVQPTGYEGLDQIKSILHLMKMDLAVARIGSPVPPLTATYWQGVDSSRHTWPVPGKVSIYLSCGFPQDAPWLWRPANAYMWQQLAHKYGSALNITLMCKTAGYFKNGEPLTPPQEAARLGKFFVDEVHLPVTVAVQETQVQRLPDGRILKGTAPFERDPYYRWSFILADQSGKILLLGPPLVYLDNQKFLEAWIDRALGR